MAFVTSCKGSDTPIVPDVSVKEKSIVIIEYVSRDFTLEINANIPIVFDLPAWIKEKDGNTPATGKKTYSFQADALPEGEKTRTGNLTVKSTNTDFGVSIEIPVKQSSEICILRIASYNMYYLEWSSRATMVNALIRKYDFDIIGTQETYYSQHIRSITGDGTYGYTGIGRDNIQTSEHVAIIYKKERFDLLNSGNFWFSETPDVPSYGWGATTRRICTWGKFKDVVSGCEFFVFNSHFDHAGSSSTARVESAKLLLKKIKEIAGDLPVFATGDLNCQPNSEPVQIILNDGLLGDARELSKKTPEGPEGTFTNFNTAQSKSRIDFIFVTKNIQVNEYRVIDDRPNDQFPSDHDPVLVIAEF